MAFALVMKMNSSNAPANKYLNIPLRHHAMRSYKNGL